MSIITHGTLTVSIKTGRNLHKDFETETPYSCPVI